jgi:plastocyanin
MADEEAPTTDAPAEVTAGEGAGGTAVATQAPAALEAAHDAHREAMRTRVIIPLVLPLITAAAILVYVLNLSRALLAGGKWGALAIASIVTVTILFGAAFISSRPRMRTSTLVMLVSVLFLLVLASGLTTIGPSEEKEAASTGFQQPTGKPVDTLSVTALPTIKFNATAYSVKAGIVRVNYIDGGGTHTLVFDSPKLNGFELAVPGGPKTGKVDLTPGKYTIFCTIPGHRALGMQATVTVTQ